MTRLLLILFVSAAGRLLAAPSITIGEIKMFQAYAPSESKVGLREYLPAGEDLQNWKRMGSIRVFKDQKDPTAYLTAVAAQVTKSHPSARYQFLRDEKTKTLILDFMTFPPESVQPPYAEWNLMRAEYVEGKGLVVYQYAMRIFDLGPQTGPIVNAERNKMVAPFVVATFEETTQPNQALEPTPMSVTSPAAQEPRRP